MEEEKIGVLRLGHRVERDKRITTHVFLAARALGADFGILCGDRDKSVMESVKDITDRWGGDFKIRYEEGWRRVVKNWEGKVVHLTMYGLPVEDEIGEIRKLSEDILIVIGGEKVPGEMYKLSDYNISVTQQPHSEVAALGVFLDRYFKGSELRKEFRGAKIKLKPSAEGKEIIENEKKRDH